MACRQLGNSVLDRLGCAWVHHPYGLTFAQHEADISWRYPKAFQALDLGVLLRADEPHDIEGGRALGQDLEQAVVPALLEFPLPGECGDRCG